MRAGRPRSVIAAAVAVLAVTLIPSARSQDAPNLPDEAEKIGDDRYRLGKVVVDLKARTVTCPGSVNMDRQLVEYLAVAPGGKLHESVLSVDVRPLHLQLGLILLGLEPKGGLRYQGDTRLPQGSPLNVFVSWQRAGRSVKVAAEDLFWDTQGRKTMTRGAWVFSGSSVDKEGFVADRELSLVASYRDPAAIVNNALPSGSDDAYYKANPRVVPAMRTAVTVTFTPRAVPPK